MSSVQSSPQPEAAPSSPSVQIERKPFEGETYDVMGGSARWEVKVHDHGLVALVDVMPRLVPAGKTETSCPPAPPVPGRNHQGAGAAGSKNKRMSAFP